MPAERTSPSSWGSLTFARNATPSSYNDSDHDGYRAFINSSTETQQSGSFSQIATPALRFPPSQFAVKAPTRRRAPPGKRRSQGYIPRPPNAFMLFRANFTKGDYVPGTLGASHGSLSKIIGDTWQKLPPHEKRVWTEQADMEKAKHKLQYPNYKFKPVHDKNKKLKEVVGKGPRKKAETKEEEARCNAVADLLISGYRGEALATAVRALDTHLGNQSVLSEVDSQDQLLSPSTSWRGTRGSRRSSSVPPISMLNHFGGGGIALPAVPSVLKPNTVPRPVSPFGARARAIYGHRRSSSAGAAHEYVEERMLPPIYTGSYTLPSSYDDLPLSFQEQDGEAFQQPDTSLFDPNFSIQHYPASNQHYSPQQMPTYNFSDLLSSINNENQLRLQMDCLAPPHSVSPHELSLSPHLLTPPYSTTTSLSAMSSPLSLLYPYSQSNSPFTDNHANLALHSSPVSEHEQQVDSSDIIAPQPKSAIDTTFPGLWDGEYSPKPPSRTLSPLSGDMPSPLVTESSDTAAYMDSTVEPAVPSFTPLSSPLTRVLTLSDDDMLGMSPHWEIMQSSGCDLDLNIDSTEKGGDSST